MICSMSQVDDQAGFLMATAGHFRIRLGLSTAATFPRLRNVSCSKVIRGGSLNSRIPSASVGSGSLAFCCSFQWWCANKLNLETPTIEN